jgi:hypothetical protein
MKKILTLAVVISALYSANSYAGGSEPDNAFAQLYFEKNVLAGGFDMSTTFVATLQADDKADGDKYIFTTTAYVKEKDEVKHVCKSSNIGCDIYKDCPHLISLNSSAMVLGFLREKQNILPCADGANVLDVTNMSLAPVTAFEK